MSKKHTSSQSKSFPLDLKKGGVIVVILALLVLGANAILSRQGKALPTEIVGLAETVVVDALATDEQPVTGVAVPPDTQKPPTRTPQTAATTEPPPDTAITDGLPWAGTDGDFDYYTLALSWQPAFCETRPDKEECETQTDERYDAANFVLHGLWPNLKDDDAHTFGYCDVSQTVIKQDDASEWCAMPELDLSDEVWQDLTILMPGSASCLQNHEWYKHGTCAGMPADAYFALANALVTQFAKTDFNRYVAERIGREVTRNELLSQFDAEFGDGASDYLSLRCNKVGGDSLLTEIQIALQTDLGAVDDFATLFPDIDVPIQGNCPQSFEIDRVGLGD